MNQYSNKWKSYLNINYILLLVIVIAGTILRFYNYSELPYSFDEFSALFRTRFDNSRDLIYYGVKTTDTHPAGVQVFMYYWVKLFGESEMVVKFPFLVFGILSIIWGYKVAAKWFNPTVGLIVALFLSVLQYPITYSQFARPYVSGLFFGLLMVWYWTLVVFQSDKKPVRNFIGFVISSALCAYNHHFSLLLVGMVGISGLFFIGKKNLVKYLIACTVVFILYIPHLPIFFYQLNQGGVEDWLGKPKPSFILDYFQYILHFSISLFVLVCIVIILQVFFLTREFKRTIKFRLLAFFWFAITYLAGYFYSVHFNAVLQYSVLIFTFPLLILFLFSFFRDMPNLFKTIVVLVFIFIGVYTLIFEREHYEIQYKSPYKEILIESERINEKFGSENVSIITRIPLNIKEYYFDNLNIKADNYYDIDSLGNFIEFRRFLSTLKSEYMVLAWSSIGRLEYKLIAEEFFPYVIKKVDWFKGNLFLYAKNYSGNEPYESADSILYASINHYDSFDEGWKDVELPYQLTSGVNYEGDKILILNKVFEYSTPFRERLDKIALDKTNEICISVDVYFQDKLADPLLICDFNSEGERIGWRAANVSEFINEPNKRLKSYLALKLVDIDLTARDIYISTYMWNEDFEEAYLDEFKIEVRKGNPRIYGLYEKF